MARRLIVNADDFGLTAGVSRAILKAHREGILTSTTFMVNFPWAGEMAALLAGAPRLGVGLHLNLTTGAPVLPPDQVPSLVGPDGRFVRDLLRLLRRARPAEAEREWSAQLERFVALVGRLPTHLDTHRYLQAWPPLCRAMLAVARRYGVGAVRVLPPDVFPPGTFPRWSPAGPVLRAVLRRTAAMIRKSGLRAPDRTLAGDFDLPGLLDRLDRAGEGATEIVTHPGEVDDELRALSSLTAQRAVELAALTAPAARETVERLGLQLIHFGDL
ncbi:carbohydrate deacetylase [Symbiobacterium terraclitae]|uniref:carbohydrate deacetylase n=1 Tax=Symbiobacterium terraclitae TaxID=557451 RepID=UPI0035B4FFC3